MRRRGWRPYVDLVEVDTIEVVLEEDEPVDEFLELLREIALEAIALRAHSPGDPRIEVYDEEAPAPDEGNAATRLLRRFGRRRLVLVAAIVAAALAAAIAPGALEARRAAARLAALEASPGVLTSASNPATEVWRAPGRVVDDRAGTLLVAGVRDGSLRRVDPATGHAMWTVQSGAALITRCFPMDGPGGKDGARAADGASSPAPVACVAEADPNRSEADPPPARIVVLDPSAGTVRRTVPVHGSLLAAEPLDGDLLVVARLADGRLSAGRWGPEASAPRWEYTGRRAVLADESGALTLRSQSLDVDGLALDLATGEERTAEDVRLQPIGLEEHILPGGEHATWWRYADGAYGQGRVASDHGMRMIVLLGPPLVPALTDGSQVSTLVTTADGDRLRGLDLRNGRIRWSRTYPGATSVRATVQVDGVMILDDGTTVTAIDVSTGDDVWSTAVDPEVARGSALTDGEVLLLPERDADAGVQLVAHRIEDGATLWRAEMPTGTVSLSVVDQRLVASTGGQVVGLG